ncbi:tumor protein D53 homolog isoform X1 [Hypanus sabinus]|uniref:tumor protein D53 homolog isoform X1 n=1 Tax=Hypanus sabinus TaxID=79690 RepID=UPI0028C452F2|nr:tumor protein D53 homolog isoform X1 [Hypanus sabinus]
MDVTERGWISRWDDTGCRRTLLETGCLSDLDANVDIGTNPEIKKEELHVELAKLEDEIAALRQTLIAKEKHLIEIKQKMGITPLNEIKHNLSKSWHEMQTSVIYKKTQETLNNTGQKASAALNNVSSTLTKKLGEMNLHYLRLLLPNRNSPTLKSFEERVETTVSSLKCKVGVPTRSSGSFEDVLSSAANASVQESSPGCQQAKDFGAF